MSARRASFASFVRAQRRKSSLVVQPRMGFGRLDIMRRGLLAVKSSRAITIGTLTLDSYTRVNDYAAAARALYAGTDLNGFPIVTHGPEKTQRMLEGIHDDGFPVQVRHGTALPVDVIRIMIAAGIDATEGGPISYCLPYSRVPLAQSITAWRACCELLAAGRAEGIINHLESFGGCMLGQMCPPSLLIALTILEGLFFQRHGLLSISLSYAQGTSAAQDGAALRVLRKIAARCFATLDWHVVFYTYMGVFPQTAAGANKILEESARIAMHSGCERLIVKTSAEARRIPTIEENVAALELAHDAATRAPQWPIETDHEEEMNIYEEAVTLIDAVLNLCQDLDRALWLAFHKGYLDVPYCLHQDNRNRTRAIINTRGYLQWMDIGRLPFVASTSVRARVGRVCSDDLLQMLHYNQRRYDGGSAPRMV